ncbi:hypothetical protein AWM75_05260 [Aerococcus urinaehominis]|uniref:Putative gluconeogenesis factor n=1 Tax=Aerococcus urinaehominis TaxID=128944 RepID=A0A0X8FLC5_9LACT|nr:uridine diphosphate-N-acetylglucosamine-binding protein YvcK [Aerococcus urinaehominis]AMB99437.1 hypothetical protein AWM75_05260 [Aerococcus urinaehominis]SDM29036.1 conserved hypothetical protein, cofD-related [Aerococcus urinaehominis]
MIANENERPKITVIGGGTGLPVLLSGLKEANCDVTAIVTVADDGGSSGAIRNSVKTIPPGDIRNCLVALSNIEDIYKDIFQYRFAPEDQEFSGHAIGNLIIAALAEMRGDVYAALKLLAMMMDVQGQVLPAAEEPLVLQAHFQDGSFIEGETSIVAKRQAIDKIGVRVVDGYEARRPHAGRGVLKAIETADFIILGPGSLYTSILPNLVIDEIRQAILDTPAQLLYICNIMTQIGETEHFSDADHVRVINSHLGQNRVDYILANNAVVPKAYINRPETPEYLVQVSHDSVGLADQGIQLVEADFLALEDKGVYHDRRKLVNEILKIYRRHYK